MKIRDFNNANQMRKTAKFYEVLDFINNAPKGFKEIVLQDLGRWIFDHRLNELELDEAFAQLWCKRQEFRSVIKYRMRCAELTMNYDCSNFRKICAGHSWLFVRDLYISCEDIGPGLYVEHGYCTTIYAKKIGENFRVNQLVTIGSNKGGIPIIGDNVSVFTHAVIVGEIGVGNNVKIGAGAVVTKSVPSSCTVVPHNMRIIIRNT